MRTWILLITLLLSCSLAGAEMYRWIAEDGSVTFKDTPPPASKKRKNVKIYEESDFAPAPPQQPAPANRGSRKASQPAQPKPAQTARFSGTVEIYVTDWCGYCKKAQDYMNRNGIRYVAYDIEKDSGAKQRHKELGGRGVPLIIIGSNKMSGFSPEHLEYYLNNSK